MAAARLLSGSVSALLLLGNVDLNDKVFDELNEHAIMRHANSD